MFPNEILLKIAYLADMGARRSLECVNATHCKCGHAFAVIRSVNDEATNDAASYLSHVCTVTNACRTLEDVVRSLSLQWVPSHFVVSGNNRADTTTAVARFVDPFIDPFMVASRMPHQEISSSHPSTGVSMGTSPPPVPKSPFGVHVRFSTVFVKTARLHELFSTGLVGRESGSNCVWSGAYEVIEHVLWWLANLRRLKKYLEFYSAASLISMATP